MRLSSLLYHRPPSSLLIIVVYLVLSMSIRQTLSLPLMSPLRVISRSSGVGVDRMKMRLLFVNRRASYQSLCSSSVLYSTVRDNDSSGGKLRVLEGFKEGVPVCI